MIHNYRKAFKAYDIRGIYGKEIDEQFAYTMGKAIGTYMIQTFGKNSTLLIASDVRKANISLLRNFETWLAQSGFFWISYAAFDQSEEYPYGICSTAMAYYLTQNYFDLGVSFTASHNPPEHVGMKFFDREVALLSTEMLRGLFQQAYIADEQIDLRHRDDHTLDEKIVKKEESLFERLKKKWEWLTKPYHFVVDLSNGAAVTSEKKKLTKYIDNRHTVHFINDTADSDFKAHHSDTQEHVNYRQLAEKIDETWASFGVMFDGDADRIGIIGPDGRIVGWDIIGAMIARQILLEWNTDFENIILHETMCAKIFHDTINNAWGEARMTRVGRYFINQELAECRWIFAGESSGHFLFGEVGNYEMPLLALYYFMKEMEEYASREALIDAYVIRAKSPVISIIVQDKDAVIEKIKEKYAEHEQQRIDGISIYAPDFWFNMRPSNTEDKIKFTVEADTPEQMELVVEQLKWIINDVNSLTQ